MERHLTGTRKGITSNSTLICCPRCADQMWHTVRNENDDKAVLDCERCGFMVKGKREVLAHYQDGQRFANRIYAVIRNKGRVKHVIQRLLGG